MQKAFVHNAQTPKNNAKLHRKGKPVKQVFHSVFSHNFLRRSIKLTGNTFKAIAKLGGIKNAFPFYIQKVALFNLTEQIIIGNQKCKRHFKFKRNTQNAIALFHSIKKFFTQTTHTLINAKKLKNIPHNQAFNRINYNEQSTNG